MSEMQTMRVPNSKSSSIAPGMAISAEALARSTEITEDQIAETLANWDVRACGQRIFVARLKHTTSAGGLVIIPDEAQKDQCDGVVISAGPLAYVNDLQPKDEKEAEERRWLSPDELDCATRRFLKPGNRITFGKWSGETVSRKATVKRGLDQLMVMNADDCIGDPAVIGAVQ